MASITIIEAPQKYMPVYNDIVYTVSSPQASNCNFRYICDVYCDQGGFTPTFVTRLKQAPVSPLGYATFKINRILEDFISYELTPAMFDFNSSAVNTNILNYQCKFGVEYDTSANCDAGTTIFPNLTSGSSIYAINAALQYKEWPNWNPSTFLLNATLPDTRRFLTNAPTIDNFGLVSDGIMIGQGDEFVLNVLTETVVTYMEVQALDAAGNTVGLVLFDCNVSSAAGTGQRVLLVPAGPANLNGFNFTLAAGTLPIITKDVASYSIVLLNSGTQPISRFFQFVIDRRPSMSTPYRLWWLNRLGGFDSYTFTLANKRNVTSKRNNYTKLLGNPGHTTYKYDPKFGPRGSTVLSVDSQETQIFQSNWLTEDEALWMEELFTSPEVYISDITPTSCFTNTFNPGTGKLRVYLDGPTTFIVGDSILVDKNDKSINPTYDGYKTVTTVQNYPPYYLEYTQSVGTVGNGESGTIYKQRYASSLDPVVITSASWDQLLKNDVKNIQYFITLEKAYIKTIQRG